MSLNFGRRRQVVLNKEINQETVDMMYVRCTYIFCSLPLI